MDEKLIELIEELGDEELDEDEAEAISKAANEGVLQGLKGTLEMFSRWQDELPAEVLTEISKLINFIKDLVPQGEEEEEEEDSEGKKVKKKKDWSFTFTPEKD